VRRFSGIHRGLYRKGVGGEGPERWCGLQTPSPGMIDERSARNHLKRRFYVGPGDSAATVGSDGGRPLPHSSIPQLRGGRPSRAPGFPIPDKGEEMIEIHDYR